MLPSNVRTRIRRRALQAGIKTEIGCHTSRATRIIAYLKNGGKLEVAQQMAAHDSFRTTALNYRRDDEISLDQGIRENGSSFENEIDSRKEYLLPPVRFAALPANKIDGQTERLLY